MRNLTATEWRTVITVAAAVVAYLLVQTDVPLEGWFKVALGATAVALAAVSPNRLAGGA